MQYIRIVFHNLLDKIKAPASFVTPTIKGLVLLATMEAGCCGRYPNLSPTINLKPLTNCNPRSSLFS